MIVTEISNKNQWNNFIAANNRSFLQSWEWGNAQSGVGRKVWRLGLIENNNISAGISILKYNLIFGKNYLFAPWSGWNRKEHQKLLFEKIKKIGFQENAIFFRYEPMTERMVGIDKLQMESLCPMRFAGFMEPKDTLLIDLTKSEEKLLAEMHPKTRYNIKLAEKKGVIINRCRGGSIQNGQFENFWQLIEQTYNRKNIRTHNKNYYKKILEQDIFQLYLARYQGKIIVANLLSFFGDTVTYIHGGSDKNFQNSMASPLIQWQAIKDAKARGYKYYDFYGIMPGNDSNKKNPWAGITRFKKGFGGKEKHYVGCWDLVFNKRWYLMYKIGKRLKNF